MFDLACPAKADTFGIRPALLAVRDLIYSDLSQKAHLTFLGFVKQSRPVLMGTASPTLSPSISERHQSGELFVSLTLVSVLLAWMDRFFRLEVADRIRSTWRILGEYDPIASKIYQAWYPDTGENPISL